MALDAHNAFIALAPLAGTAEPSARTGALSGLRVAVKANVAVAGLPLSACVAYLADAIAPADAGLVARLRDAGATILGLVNMDEGALGAACDNPLHGPTDNPALSGHTPGGSSGGSAAAVAGHLADIAIGSDTLGSIRIPAAYCGVAGFKPSRSVVPDDGTLALAPTLDVYGPIAGSAAMLGRAMAVLGRIDPVAPSTAIRLGRPDTSEVELTPEVAAAFHRALDGLTRAGIRVDPVTVEGWDPGALRRAGLLVAEHEGAIVHRRALADGLAMSDTLRRMLTYGRDAPAERIEAARRLIDMVKATVDAALDGLDALVLPTAPQTAFRHGEPAPANQADLTALASLADLPAASLPLLAARPVGLQLIGRRRGDAALLGLLPVIEAAIR